MDWLNLHIPSQIRSPEFVGSSPAERGTWLCVLAYACQIECGGRLPGAARWKDRQWQQAAGVTLREVRASSRLLVIDGDDVVVNGYPEAREEELARDRSVGRCGGKARTDAKGRAARMNGSKGGRPRKPNEETQQEPNETQLNPSQNPREGEGEGEGEGEVRASARPPTPPDSNLEDPRDVRTRLESAGAQWLVQDWPAWQAAIARSGIDRVEAAVRRLVAEGGVPRCTAVVEVLRLDDEREAAAQRIRDARVAEQRRVDEASAARERAERADRDAIPEARALLAQADALANDPVANVTEQGIKAIASLRASIEAGRGVGLALVRVRLAIPELARPAATVTP